MLGGFRLAIGGREVAIPNGSQRLLAYLALHPRQQRRVVVAAALWPDSGPTRALASLRSTLWRVRAMDSDMIVTADDQLSLSPAIAIDIHELEATVARLRKPGAAGMWDLDPVRLRGELLPGWTLDEWTWIERERLRQLRLHGLEALATTLMRLGRYAEAVETGLAAVRDEPLRESAHRVVICAHRAEGNPGEALRHYRWYVRLLRRELGVAPSPFVATLVADLTDRGTAMGRPLPSDAQHRASPGV